MPATQTAPAAAAKIRTSGARPRPENTGSFYRGRRPGSLGWSHDEGPRQAEEVGEDARAEVAQREAQGEEGQEGLRLHQLLDSVSLAGNPLVPPDPPLTDGEIVLRLRRAEDVPAIATASRDRETQRWLEGEPMTPEREAGSLERAAEQWRSGNGAPFVIADVADDRPLGLLNLQLAEAATLAVSVFPEARGRGLAPRALRLGASWALRELGLARVVAEVDPGNTASVRAIEKAGFRREGIRDGKETFV